MDEIELNSAKGAALIVITAMLFGTVALMMDAPRISCEQTSAEPIVVKHVYIQEPKVLTPPGMMEWPLAARMIADVEPVKRAQAREEVEVPMPPVVARDDAKEERRHRRHHRGRHHRRR